MIGKISFKEDSVVSIYLPGNPISVHHYGGVEFTGDSPVQYKIIMDRKNDAFYAYLVVLQEMKKAILFDDEPQYDKKNNCYTSTGMSLPLDIEPGNEPDVNLTPVDLIVLHAI